MQNNHKEFGYHDKVLLLLPFWAPLIPPLGISCLKTFLEKRGTLDLITELADDIYEVWCSPFSYYLNGQVKSDSWLKHSVPLYPDSALDMLILQTWMLNTEPSREETYRRMNKLIEHCKYLRIPIPYSLSDICTADQRWKGLHQNAVPSLVEFTTYINECKNIEKLYLLQNQFQDKGDFNF